MDDRFQDPNTFRKPQPVSNSDWTSPEDFFMKVIASGEHEHEIVQTLKRQFPDAYDRALARVKGVK